MSLYIVSLDKLWQRQEFKNSWKRLNMLQTNFFCLEEVFYDTINFRKINLIYFFNFVTDAQDK